jgi:hypothetical protein
LDRFGIRAGAKKPIMALTTVDLYRSGNSSNARLDNLRNVDVDVYTHGTQNEICVRAANTKGVSTWDSIARLISLGGRSWHLPANSTYDDTRLFLWETYPASGKWNWTPTRDMPGSEFIAALRAVNALFQ